MNELPASVRPVLRRLAQRLAVGLFLDVWPMWAVGSLLVAGLAALVCRMFFASAATWLSWLWPAPLLTALPCAPHLLQTRVPADQVVALADWLNGGQGMLLTLFERNDSAWAESPILERASRLPLPQLRPWRKLAPVPLALAFLGAALLLPQRLPALAPNAILADDIAADSSATVLELKQQTLITPVEEQKLEEEIERIRKSARERVDASSWEAADALRERVAAGLSQKQDAAKWAQESLARAAAAAQAGANGVSSGDAAELTKALENLAQSGLLAGAPSDLQRLLAGGKGSLDAAALQKLAAALGEDPRRDQRTLRGSQQPGQGIRPVQSRGLSSRLRGGSGRRRDPGTRRDQSGPSRRGSHLGQGVAPTRPVQSRTATTGRRAQSRRLGAARGVAGGAAGVSRTESRIGGQGVCGRHRPDRVAPFAGATAPERSEEVFREMSH